MKFNKFFCFLSVLLYHFLMLAWVVQTLTVIPEVHDEDGRLVDKKFVKTKKPIWFGHITDLHITGELNRTEKNLRDAFKAFNVIDPSKIFITGDIVNTYNQPENHCNTSLVPEQFDLYRKIRDETVKDKSKLFVTIGNHDSWETLSWDTYIGRDIFTLDPGKYSDSIVVDGVRLVMYNPIMTPVSTGDVMTFWLSPFPETLEALENELEKETDAEETFVITHQATEMYLPEMRSRKTNRTLLEILEEPKYNIIALINGHTHPPDTQFRRYKNFIECTHVCLKDNRKIGVISLDNGRLSYSTLPLDTDKDFSIVTYPIPNNAALHSYTKDDFQVRLISFSNEDKNFVVSGDVNGVMHKDTQLNDNAWLYTLDADISDGNHTIQISGDADITINFTIGQNIEGRWHVRMLDFNLINFSTVIFVAAVIIIIETVPAFLPDKLFSKFDRINEWLKTGEGESHYLSSLIFGPILTARRFKNHKIIAATLIVSLISAFVSPILFYQVKGIPSRLMINGFYIGSYFHYDVMPRYFVGDALVFLYMPLAVLCSLLYFRISFPSVLVSFVCFGLFYKGYSDAWVYLYKVDPSCWLQSPLFFGFPLLIAIEFIVSLFVSKEKKHQKTE